MARNSSFVVLLLGLCISASARADDPAAVPPATTQQIQQTVDRAIGYLQTESAAWLKTRQCAACHHVPMPLWALSEARRQGYAIDQKFVADTTESLLGSQDKLLSSKIFPNPADPPDPRPQGRGLNMGLPFLAVAARSGPSLTQGQQQSLQLIAEEIVRKQQPDGSWEFFATLRRPPINESQTTDAAWIIMALEGEMLPDAPESHRAALSKAIAWLDAAKLGDLHQEKVLKVLLGVRAAKPREALQPTIDELLARQRADGGWSQTIPEPQSDAFATGQTLYVLSLAGYTARRPEIKRAIDFLVATQSTDGSWPMDSRSTPDGSPGSSTLLTPIICTASSWATLGLARLVPNEMDDSDDASSTDGTWLASAAELGGEKFPDEVRKSISLVIDDGKYTVMVGKNPDRGTVKLDPSKKPMEIDITGTEGPNKGKTFLAIYEKTGDTLRVCYDLSGKARPAEFKSEKGTLQFLVTYERRKP